MADVISTRAHARGSACLLATPASNSRRNSIEHKQEILEVRKVPELISASTIEVAIPFATADHEMLVAFRRRMRRKASGLW
jgi:hypothetical protein